MENNLPQKNPRIFWNWFSRHEKNFHDLNQENSSKFFLKFYRYLIKFNPYLGFEFTNENSNEKTELIITANNNPQYFNTVFSLINAAPNHLKERWIFTALKQPDFKDDIKLYFEDLIIQSNDIFYEIEESEDIPGKYDLLVYIKGVSYDSEDLEGYVTITISALIDRIIGEYLSSLKLNEIILVEKGELLTPKKITELKNEFEN